MTIYLDIIFVENILMNYIILFATLVILKAKNKWQQIRLLVSGVIGSCICHHCIFRHTSNIFWNNCKGNIINSNGICSI